MARKREPTAREPAPVTVVGLRRGRRVEAMPEAVVVCDAEGRIVAANDALHTLLGYPDGRLIGRKLEKLVPDDLRDLHRAYCTEFARDPGPGGHRDGCSRPATVTATSSRSTSPSPTSAPTTGRSRWRCCAT